MKSVSTGPQWVKLRKLELSYDYVGRIEVHAWGAGLLGCTLHGSPGRETEEH